MPQHHESCSYSLSPTLSCQARASTSLMTTPDKINIFVPQSPLKLSSQELLRWLSVKLAGQPDNTEDDSSGLSSDLKSLFHPHTPTQTHTNKIHAIKKKKRKRMNCQVCRYKSVTPVIHEAEAGGWKVQVLLTLQH